MLGVVSVCLIWAISDTQGGWTGEAKTRNSVRCADGGRTLPFAIVYPVSSARRTPRTAIVAENSSFNCGEAVAKLNRIPSSAAQTAMPVPRTDRDSSVDAYWPGSASRALDEATQYVSFPRPAGFRSAIRRNETNCPLAQRIVVISCQRGSATNGGERRKGTPASTSTRGGRNGRGWAEWRGLGRMPGTGWNIRD